MKRYKDFAQQKFIHTANLYWIVNGQIKETILSNVPYPIAASRKRILNHTCNYKPGILAIISTRTKDLKEAIKKYN